MKHDKIAARRCAVTGETKDKADMIRFVLFPDRPKPVVTPDINEKLPGRGVWVTADHAILAQAIARNIFNKAFQTATSVPDRLIETIQMLLRKKCLELISLARKAGLSVAGADKVIDFAARQKAFLLLSATDGSEAETTRIAKRLKPTHILSLFSSEELGACFGRDQTIHAVAGTGKLAEEIVIAAEKLRKLVENPSVPG